MKRFLLKSLIFLSPFIILFIPFAVPLDHAISSLLKQSNNFPGEFEVWNDIYNQKANCDIAIYGSSRAWVHIDPQILTDTFQVPVYNFGIDGHNFWLQYLRHLEFIKNNNKPKLIIYSVDIFSLQKRRDLYELDQFLPYMLWNENITKYTSSFIGFNEKDYDFPLIRYAGKSQALATSLKILLSGGSPNKFRQNGFRGLNNVWNSDLDKAKQKINKYQIEFDPTSIELFERFIVECIESDIKIIFVYTPEYIEGQEFVTNRNEVIKIFTEYALKYDLTFIDYSNDDICFNKDLFYNASHLNSKGAEIFTKKMSSDIKVEMNKIAYK